MQRPLCKQQGQALAQGRRSLWHRPQLKTSTSRHGSVRVAAAMSPNPLPSSLLAHLHKDPRSLTRLAAQIQAAPAVGEKSEVLVQLSVPHKTPYGSIVKVVGGSPELGRWDVAKAPSLHWTQGDVWKGELRLPAASSSHEFKVVTVDTGSEQVSWEPGKNRVLEVPKFSGTLEVSCTWGQHKMSTKFTDAPRESLDPIELVVQEAVVGSATAAAATAAALAEASANSITATAPTTATAIATMSHVVTDPDGGAAQVEEEGVLDGAAVPRSQVAATAQAVQAEVAELLGSSEPPLPSSLTALTQQVPAAPTESTTTMGVTTTTTPGTAPPAAAVESETITLVRSDVTSVTDATQADLSFPAASERTPIPPTPSVETVLAAAVVMAPEPETVLAPEPPKPSTTMVSEVTGSLDMEPMAVATEELVVLETPPPVEASAPLLATTLTDMAKELSNETAAAVSNIMASDSSSVTPELPTSSQSVPASQISSSQISSESAEEPHSSTAVDALHQMMDNYSKAARDVMKKVQAVMHMPGAAEEQQQQ